METFYRPTAAALIAFAGIAILSAALFAAHHGRAIVACAL